jgi:hypothetical protein
MKVGNISIGGYGNYSSKNYGVNALRVQIGGLALWFSYQTIVAFREPGKLVRVCENCWGTTTGGHLNAIDDGDKKSRLKPEVFQAELSDLLTRHGLNEGE